MKNKIKYETPCVLENIVVELEHEILGASVITEDTTVETTGQEFVEYDFTGEEYYHKWE